MSATILLTGGAGYIGSHTAVELLEAGYSVVVVDNLSNSSREVLARIERITGRPVIFYQVDIRDRKALSAVFRAHRIAAVIHFAGLKAVGESVAFPLRYYQNNLVGTINLLEVMGEAGVDALIFSSSATVYGDPASVPVLEEFPLAATNPYGRCKLMIEEILRDLQQAEQRWRIVLLRYFNPVGAHKSGFIGEDPRGIPNNLMPYVARVAVGTLKELVVFGHDYPTPDGTGVRDYIHVTDLAAGHLAALARVIGSAALAGEDGGVLTYNLGTGRGYSVLEIVRAFAKASGREIPYRFSGRRPGDVAIYYADPSLAYRELGWKTERDLDRMCADAWRWQSGNPHGYGGEEEGR